MTDHSRPVHVDAANRVRALLEGTLDAAAREETIAHLRTCESCAALYDRLAAAEHRAAGGNGVLGGPALHRVAERLGLDAQQRAAPAPARSRGWIATLAAATMLVIAVVAVRPPEFVSRGSTTRSAQLGMRLFRMQETDGRVRAVEIRRSSEVHRGERIGVSYTNLGSARYATWLVVAGKNGPAVLTEVTGPVRQDVVDEPLDPVIAVDGRFPSGPVRIVVIFSEAELHAGDLAKRAAARDVSAFEIRVVDP